MDRILRNGCDQKRWLSQGVFEGRVVAVFFYPTGQLWKRGVYEGFEETEAWEYFQPDGMPSKLQETEREKDL